LFSGRLIPFETKSSSKCGFGRLGSNRSLCTAANLTHKRVFPPSALPRPTAQPRNDNLALAATGYNRSDPNNHGWSKVWIQISCTYREDKVLHIEPLPWSQKLGCSTACLWVVASPLIPDLLHNFHHVHLYI
jgi:hypothetical protein